jgi:aminoglycoside 3-N-acetyltransferase
MPGTFLYHVSRRLLSQRARDRAKAGLAWGRHALTPAMRRWHGPFDAAALMDELRARLPERFDVLLVHASMGDLAPMYMGGAPDLLQALRELCSAHRTLVMPAFTYLVPGGDLLAHFRANPRFDGRRAPSQMGLLSEVFRRTAGVRRSLHPTHSVCALGPHAERLTASHHLAATTFGEDTPYDVLTKLNSVIVGLGTPYFRCLTQIHHAEDALGERFPLRRRMETVDLTLADGRGDFPYRLQHWVDAPVRRIDRLARLMPASELQAWSFHGVPLFWTRAAAVSRALLDAAGRGKTLYTGPTLAG